MRKTGAWLRAGVIALAIAGPAAVAAEPIEALVLVAQGGGTFDYGIQVALDHGLVLAPGSAVTVSGLAGVTHASVESTLALCFTADLVQSDEVRFTSVPTCPVFDPVAATLVLGDLQVFSTSSSIGPASYAIEAGNAGIVSGTVPGPVPGPVNVPEPYTFPLAAIGLVACTSLLPRASGRKRSPA